MAVKSAKAQFKAWNIQHFKRLAKYNARVEALLNQAIVNATSIVSRHGVEAKDKPFSFSDDRQMKAEADSIMKELTREITALTQSAECAEWKRAYEQSVGYIGELYKVALQSKYLQDEYAERLVGMKARNLDALEAFQKRKIGGMNLSGRIWEYTEDFQRQMEVSIDTALLEGKSAHKLALSVQELLKNPDALFRRVRDENDELRMSKAMEAYHPGPGRYRSAYKNAMRLARSEINMAYRASDSQTAQDFDCIVGIEINLSNNHTCNGKPFEDICDELKGKYPKNFIFTGWHPQCRCFITYILKTDDEFWADLEADENNESVNTVHDVPDSFKEWVGKNEERIAKAEERGTLPYFLRDNKGYKEQVLLEKGANFVKPSIPTINRQYSYSSQTDSDAYARYLLESYGIVYGEKSGLSTRYMDMLDKGSITPKEVVKMLSNIGNEDIIAVSKCMEHEKELESISISTIHSPWRAEYQELIRKINAHDFTNGCKDIYPEIEQAYSIFKLSTNQSAIDYGLDRLSSKTPYNIFTEIMPAVKDFSMPKRELFDALDRFVPMHTNLDTETHYVPFFGHVNISLTDPHHLDVLNNSQWYDSSVFYHEYGHAIFHQKNLSNNADLASLFDSWASGVTSEKEDSIFRIIDDAYEKGANKIIDDFYLKDAYLQEVERINKAYQDADFGLITQIREQQEQRLIQEVNAWCDDYKAQVGSFTDCISAATQKYYFNWGSHSTEYFNEYENRINEFFAHCSENYFGGNVHFKSLDKDLYEAMIAFFKSIL